jgi:hypothetical protein
VFVQITAVLLAVPMHGLLAQSRNDTLRLTLSEARAMAIRGNPELTATCLNLAVARGEFRQASAFFPSNPAVELLAEGRSGNGPLAR